MWPPSPALLNTTTSYPEPIAIPSAQPGDSPTFCVPINAEWIPIVAGALQQLAQTTIWSGMTEADALAAVGAAWDLIASVANASACTVFELRFELSCTLQYSTDGGATWTDVPGWDAYFAACVGGSTGGGGGAPVPQIPGLSGTQLGCNIAGYLVQTLLRQFVARALQVVLASGFVADLIDGIVAIIPGIDAITPLIILASNALVTAIADGTASDWGSMVLTDLVWSKLGCLIATAIGDFTGWTQGVVDAITTAITGSALAPTLVLTSLAHFIDNLGIPGLSSGTAPGAVITYDCSQCGMGGTQVQAGPTGSMITPQLVVEDGTTTVTGVNDLHVVGGVVSGTTGTATITITEPPTPAPSDAGSVLVTISTGQAVGTAAVVFTTTFASAPDVIAGSASGQVIASASDVTTSGFTLCLTARFAVAADTTILASWSAGAAPGGGGGGGASLTVSDGTTTVTGVLELDVVGAGVADEGGGSAQIIVPASVPTFAEIADITTYTVGDYKCSFIASDLVPIYSSLVGIGRVQCDDGNGDDPYQPYVLVLNGDTGANYDWYMAELGTQGAWDTPVQTSATGDTSINLGTLPVPIHEPYSGTTQLTITIPWYADPTAEKEVHVLVVSPDAKVWRIYGIWHNINPITQIAVQMISGYRFVDGNSLVINGYY